MTRRWWRLWKWAGVVAVGAIALAWFVSGWYGGGITYGSANREHHLILSIGTVGITSMSRDGLVIDRRDPPTPRGLAFLALERLPGGPEPQWFWVPRIVNGRGFFMVTVSLWIPLLVVAVPTAWLWRRDRRFGRGRCQRCGYDLAGLDAGACPECGERPKPRSRPVETG